VSSIDALTAAAADQGRKKPALPYSADWLVYCAIIVCTALKALVGNVGHSADAVAYLDLSDAIRDHRWHALVNGYWFPGYPALLALGRAVFGFSTRHEFMAARFVTMLAFFLFVVACLTLGESVRRLMLYRGIPESDLLPRRVLCLWVTGFSYFCGQDFMGITPDALVSAFMVLTVACLVWTRAGGGVIAYVCVGVFAAFAFWTKTFAFSFFVLLIFFSVIMDLPRFRTSRRLAVSVLVFGIIAGPYIWALSASKGRLTFGDTGRLNFAWFWNGADRFNPVEDPSMCYRGTARISFKHPGDLLAKSPEIAYFGGDVVQGSMPQWDDPSYWWDGTSPRVNIYRIVRVMMSSMATMFNLLIMRFQGVLFVVLLYFGGFALRKRSWVDAVLPASLFTAGACIGLYALVLVEGRYIAFSVAMAGILIAGVALAREKGEPNPLLNLALFLMVAVILTDGAQTSLREWKAAKSAGAQPLSGIYDDMPQLSAGTDLAHRFSPGTEVACMGDKACWADPSWARHAGVRITAVIETGNGWNTASAETGCVKLERNLSALNPLRERNVRAIVARFDADHGCSSEWIPIGKSRDFFYRPL